MPSHRSHLAKVARAILHHLPTKFVRNRANGPQQMLVVLLTIIHSGMNRGGIRSIRLDAASRFAEFIGWTDVPSTSSICRALRKVMPTEFETVISVGMAEMMKLVVPQILVHRRWVVAIDGVRVNAQRTSVLARWLGLPMLTDGRKAHQPQALVVVVRCVRTGVMLAQEIVSHDESERACARRLIAALEGMGHVLVLLDRGFPSRDFVALMQERKIDFVMRMCSGQRQWRELDGRISRRGQDMKVDIRLRAGYRSWTTTPMRCVTTPCAHRGRPRCNRTPDRLILLTNLSGRYWSRQRIVDLYHRRWDIETSFREDKRLLGMTKSHATTKNGFTNELLALQIYRMLMALVIAMAAAEAGWPRWNDPRSDRLNTPQVIVGAWQLLEMVIAAHKVDQERLGMLIREIIRDAEKRRPNRSFKRVCRGVEGVWKTKTDRNAA